VSEGGGAREPGDGVYTDGSATPNPGPGGWAAVRVVAGAVVAEASGADPATTNNRMELTALIRGIDLVPPGEAAVLYSDSQLAVRTVNEWAPAWEARGWRRSRGPVENLDLVQALVRGLRARPELRVEWIRAHVGHRWNEHADRLAARASRAGRDAGDPAATDRA
jgi:ribonuclease HI